MSELPSSADVVVIGGGIIGCSVAYHLAHLGKRVVLLERKQLTCGTTWHSAGHVGYLRPSLSLSRLAKYSGDLYQRLEAETGLTLPLFRVVLSPTVTRPFCAVPRTSVARTASG